jgi:hypothetical protein
MLQLKMYLPVFLHLDSHNDSNPEEAGNLFNDGDGVSDGIPDIRFCVASNSWR